MAKSTARPARSTSGAPLHPAAVQAFAIGSTGTPVWLVDGQHALAAEPTINTVQRAWLSAQGFKPAGRRLALLPDADGNLAGAVMGAGSAPVTSRPADPMARAELLLGALATQLPPGRYRVASTLPDPELAAVAWGLGGTRFRRYKSGEADAMPQLAMPAGADAARVHAIVEGVAFGRDLINTPASDMGPAEIEAAVRSLAKVHGAAVTSTVGDDLLEQNFPLIHAVGRASPRAPRIVDLTWSPPGHEGALPKVTLVGKGIAFDTGGLDLKPSAGMLLMKKDMGGAAAVLATAHMIMSRGLKVQLRVLIAAAENSVAGNAFRPLDVIASRAGLTVEIGNTDAEGRLVLADALALADEESPDLLVTFATLTGAARVALGPELPPLFTDDEPLAAAIAAHGLAVADPVWRLPLWSAYDAGLESAVADLNNVAEGPFGGAIIAALFLRRFVKKARHFAHFDIFGWRPAPKLLGPKGGEVQAARALFAYLEHAYGR